MMQIKKIAQQGKESVFLESCFSTWDAAQKRRKKGRDWYLSAWWPRKPTVQRAWSESIASRSGTRRPARWRGWDQRQKVRKGPDDLLPLTHSKDFSFFTEWEFEQSNDMIRLNVLKFSYWLFFWQWKELEDVTIVQIRHDDLRSW